MAAVPSAVPSAVPAAVEPVSIGLNQQIGTLSGTDASYGFAETEGSPANIPGGQSAPTVSGNPLSEHLDFIGETMGPYSPPMVTGPGPSIPYEASVAQAQAAHGMDDGSPAKNRRFAKPPANQYFTSVVKTPVYENTATYNPDGTLSYAPMGNSQVGTDIRWGDHTPLNAGIGYYIQESDRPFYNTLAAVAPVQEIGTTGYMMPYGGVESQGYNDGGTPTVYNGTPDPYVSPSPVGTEAPPLGVGF